MEDRDVETLARGGTMPLAPFDENEFSLRAEANGFTIAQLASEFDAVRQSTIALIDNMPQTAWTSLGQVIGHEITLQKQVTILLGHVAHHWEILKKRFAIRN